MVDKLDDLNIIEYAIKMPFSNDDNKLMNAVSIVICVLTSIFILPLVILIGHLTELRSSAYSNSPTPSFEDYEKLFNIGKNALISYLPPIFVIFLISFISILYPPVFAFILFPIYILPIISVLFAREKNYQSIYTSEIIDIALTGSYLKFWFIYLGILTYVFVTISILGVLTLGLGAVLLVPSLVSFRATYWGRAIREITKELDETNN